jgi:hypothetical protein
MLKDGDKYDFYFIVKVKRQPYLRLTTSVSSGGASVHVYSTSSTVLKGFSIAITEHACLAES